MFVDRPAPCASGETTLVDYYRYTSIQVGSRQRLLSGCRQFWKRPMTAATAVEIEDEDDALARLTIHFDRRRQVSDQVYEALKKAIISLRLPPGTLISEN